MQVSFYATLRQIVGQKTVDISIPEGATVRQLVDEVVRIYPLMRAKLLDENGELYGHVHVIVNGRDTPYLENALDTVVKPDDVVSIFPAVGGG
jgi:molybdopterin synthase sulfur carrier subunit